jgi:hypothetical protein
VSEVVFAECTSGMLSGEILYVAAWKGIRGI